MDEVREILDILGKDFWGFGFFLGDGLFSLTVQFILGPAQTLLTNRDVFVFI